MPSTWQLWYSQRLYNVCAVPENYRAVSSPPAPPIGDRYGGQYVRTNCINTPVLLIHLSSTAEYISRGFEASCKFSKYKVFFLLFCFDLNPWLGLRGEGQRENGIMWIGRPDFAMFSCFIDGNLIFACYIMINIMQMMYLF